MRVMRPLVGAVLTVVLLAGSAIAGALEDGVAAYVRQDYPTASRLLRPLAEQGDAEAQGTLGLMYPLGKASRRTTPRRRIGTGWRRTEVSPLRSSIWASCTPMALVSRRTTSRRRGGFAWRSSGTARRQSRATPRLSSSSALFMTRARGVALDHAEAARWVREAAEQGNVMHRATSATCTLGAMASHRIRRSGTLVP